MSGVELRPAVDGSDFQSTGGSRALQQYSLPDMDGNYSSDASPNQRAGRSKSQPRLRGEKSTSPSRKHDVANIVPPKLISNDELEERKSQRVAHDLRESTKIFAQANEQRNSIRQSLETDVDRRIVQRYLSRKEMLVAWGRKLERSPFLVDQVAESERIDEEHRVKLLEEARRMQRFDARKKVIKKEIILRVLAESNAIETLRSEKRLIHLEEMRLKAKQDLLRREISRDSDITDRGRTAKERNQAQYELSQENLKKQRDEQERHRMALIQKLQAKYGQIEGEPVFVTKM